MPLRHYLVIALYGAIVFLIFLDNDTTLTRHEVLASEPAREMLDTDAPWAVQPFAGEMRTAKPPTMSWMIAASMKLTGLRSEYACRLPAALAAIALAIATAAIADRLIGAPAGLLAGLATLTTYWLQLYGRLAQADIPMAAATTIAMAALAWLIPKKPPGTLTAGAPDASHDLPASTPNMLTWIAAVFYAATGASFLLKGVGPLVTLPAAVVYGLWSRDPRVWRVLRSPVGITIFAIFLFAWPVAAVITYPPIWHDWMHQTVGRLGGNLDKQTPPTVAGYFLGLPFYLIQAPVLLLPMTPAVLLGLWAARRRWRASPAARLLICWVTPFGVLITLSAWRNQHYVFPLLPAASVVAALGTLAWARSLRRPQFARPVLAGWFVLCAIGALFIQAIIAPKSDSFRVYAEFAEKANTLVPDGTPVRLIGLGEAQVAYYLETIPVRIDEPEKTPTDAPLFAICDRATLRALDATRDVVELAEARRPREKDSEKALVLARVN